MTLGFDHGGTRAPSRSARRTRTLLLAGGLAITPLGGATIVAQQASDPALSDDAAQRLRDADAAVKQLSAVSPNRLSATQRLQGPDQGLSRLLEEVPAYLPNYYHSALTAPGFRTPRAAPQADLPQEAPQGILAPDLAPDSAVDSANGSTIDSGPDAAASAARAGGRQPGLPCRGTNVYDRGGIPRLIPQREADRDPAGCEGSFQPSGATAPATNAFFASLGTNGRTCATCHQPPSGMSVSVANIEARYKATRGTDAIFAGVDGANCPSNLPPNTGDGQAFRAAHSLLLQRGVFRIFLPVPAGAEYTTEVVLDPYGCNTDPSYSRDTVNGVTSQMLSVYRRPRISANLAFITPFIQPPGAPPNGSAIMWDTREPTLASQARSATLGHAQALNQPTAAQVNEMVAFETGFFSAQSFDKAARDLAASGATGGAEALAAAPLGTGGPPGNVAFTEYATWAGVAGSAAQQRRAAIARGEALFNTKAFTISNVAGLNDIALAPGAPPNNALNGTCSTCHNQGHAGNNLFGRLGNVDIGVGGASVAHGGPPPSTALPLFRLTCTARAPSPFNGTAVLTNDPGLALISGKCADIGQFSVPQLRALSSRAPYFSDGSADSLGDVVQFYDRRFGIRLTAGERADLIRFLNAL